MDKKRDDVLVMEKLRRPPRCWTLQQIGDLFGISRQRVHQIIGNTGRMAAVSTPPQQAGVEQAPASERGLDPELAKAMDRAIARIYHTDHKK